MNSVLLVFATFLACGVEMVEALTIVLAVGVTRGWRSTLVGVAAATVSLAMIVALLAPRSHASRSTTSVSWSEPCC